MKIADLSNPIALATIIANSNANSIAVNATGTSYASQEEGFPHITMIPEDNGGEAPHGLDFNGFLKMLSSHVFNIQNGTPETFNSAVSSAIGGYPKNALLWLIDDNNSRLLKSTKDDNTDNFLTTPSVIGTSWVNAFPTQDYVDDTFVTKATAQTITGAKTFTSDVSIANDNPYIELHDNDFVKGNLPSSESIYSIYIQDKTSGISQSNRLGVFTTHVQTSGTVATFMTAYKNVANSTDSASIRVYYPTSGSPYTYAPAPSLNSNASGYANQIVTVGYLNGSNSNVVHKTDNETIAGTKTFSSDPYIKNASPFLYLEDTAQTKGTAPSADGWSAVTFHDTNGTIMGRCRQLYAADKSNRVELQVHKANSSSDTDYSVMGIKYLASGNAYGYAPNSDVNGSILTTVNKSKSSNGYFQLGNGLIVQWGTAGDINGYNTITFPKAFTSTNYRVVATQLGSNADLPSMSAVSVTGKTKTTFKVGRRAITEAATVSSIEWIAVGY